METSSRGAEVTSRALQALGLIQCDLQPQVRLAMREFNVRLDMSESTALVVTRVETRCPDLLLIDTDLLGCPGDLCRFARSLRPDVKVLALACYWSDREEGLRGCADALLHKPPRQPEWEGVLQQLGVPAVASAPHAA
jgi:DNA-binding response OmpR family regulator